MADPAPGLSATLAPVLGRPVGSSVALAARGLDEIAADIHRTWGATKAHQVDAWEGYFLTGHLVIEARTRLPQDREYGHWFEAQGFGFSTEWGRRLALLASNEDAARVAVASALATGEASGVDAVLEQLEPGRGAHVSANSGQSEWFTPAEYIEAARRVMGGIDLDPASTETANGVVKATKFYTAAQDGLGQEWTGRVWMNPPYAQPAIAHFCERLADEVDAGTVTQACALVNNATETGWFQRMARSASAICFPDGRVRFWHPDRASTTPLQGQAAFYFGERIDAFRADFLAFGFVVML